MASKSSIVPDIVWNWIIETLATYEQTDASTLIGLVRMAPAISGDLGKDAKEVVSLRILESLFPQTGDEAVVDADAGQNGKITFDSSERCEDVLNKILREQTPEHSARFEKEKWDVRSFLTHKRSSLPKCVLKKLKDMLLESSHPLLTSLKEKSKLVIPNASQNTSPVNDENLDVQDTVAKDDTNILNPRKYNDKFQENELQKADQQQLHFNNEKSPQDTHEKRVSVDNMENLESAVKLKDNKNVESNALDEDEHLNKDENSMEQDGDQTDSLMNLCVKCNEGGELLVCSSDSCPLQVHESCLGFAITFDENSNFFCPFCTYSRAISEYQEAKRKASQARNDLQAFSSFTVKKGSRPNESFKKPSEFEKNENRKQTGAFGETSEGNVANQSMREDEGKKKVKVNGNVNESDLVSRHVDKDIPQPSTPKRKFKEKESQMEIIESSSSRELRKRKAQYTPPVVVPLLRRKPIPWTKSEEETLKEGVERYSSVNDKKIPWKEILDFGHKVFHKGRTTIDLKDKWRNICKGTK
uniref:Myb-like domain-containing protein n=1 Tax=Lactuca sativa TaxID=4236 RepID=A0A9R1WWC7_LACSA|nr:hypothetical protein LSAT_V11C800420780 [Lactuca sativa]